MWRDVSGTVGGGGSNGRWTMVSSDNYTQILVEQKKKYTWRCFCGGHDDPFRPALVVGVLVSTSIVVVHGHTGGRRWQEAGGRRRLEGGGRSFRQP